MTGHIRPLAQGDLEEALGTIRTAFAPVAARFGLTRNNCPGNGAFMERERLLHIYEQGVAMFGLFIQGRMQGFVGTKPAGDGAWYLEKLAVLPDCQGNGYGSALVSHAEQYIRAAGGRRIRVGIINDHTGLKNWYVNRSFVMTGLKAFASLPFTVCHLEKTLAGQANSHKG